MRNTPPNPTSAHDHDMEEIIARAQKLQNEAASTPDQTMQIAQELGIQPHFIEAARAQLREERARAVPTPPAPAPRPMVWPWILGGLFFIFNTLIIVMLVREPSEPVEITITSPKEENPSLEDAFARQIRLVEESRGILGEQAKPIDELVRAFQAAETLSQKLTIMKRINAALGEAVFFRSRIGDARAAGILEENRELDTIFFFADP